MLAFGAVFMPRESMAGWHAWLGLGDLAQAPAIEAVMRQVSFTYGLHGIVLMVMAANVVRYRPLVVLGAWVTWSTARRSSSPTCTWGCRGCGSSATAARAC